MASRIDTPVKFRALIAAALSFGLGEALGLYVLAVRSNDNVGIGMAGGIVLASPLLALCIIPATIARLVHESRHPALSALAYAAVWFASGFAFSGGLSIRVPSFGLELVAAFGSTVLASVLVLAYGALVPFFLPLLIARLVPRRLSGQPPAPSAS